MPHPEVILLFLVIAFIYSSVGFGGGSSYLAVLVLCHFPDIKLTALICNIIVVTGGTLIFIRKKQFPFRKTLPLVLASVPMAYIGSSLNIASRTYLIVLGLCLLAAGALLLLNPMPKTQEIAQEKKGDVIRHALIGGGIGFLSGMVGIGGGIFLAPILNLMKWDAPKKIAATASFFILINSISGIAGHLSKVQNSIDYSTIGLLALAVLVGGQLGARVGVAILSQSMVRRVTGLVVFAAGANILFKQLL